MGDGHAGLDRPVAATASVVAPLGSASGTGSGIGIGIGIGTGIG
jgi:hypothetical protein